MGGVLCKVWKGGVLKHTESLPQATMAKYKTFLKVVTDTFIDLTGSKANIAIIIQTNMA